MGVQSGFPDTSGLPLFAAYEERKRREKREHTDQISRDNVEEWLSGETGINQMVVDVVSEEKRGIKEDMNFGGKQLISQYIEDGQEFGSVKVLNVEHHDFYNIAVIEISHQFPPKKYIAKGNKYNPGSGKYDGEPISYEATSTGKTEKKTYRIQYTPGKVDEKGYPIFCFGGMVKDGKRVELNQIAIIQVLNEIESLAES